jgi:hypothetical protein
MRWNTVLGTSLCLLGWPDGLQASFHFNEIQQVIGGVETKTSAQAIQIRMRQAGQELITDCRIRAFDAQGNNPVVIVKFDRDVVNARAGDTILITSATFNSLTDPPTVPDFTMTNLIPASYLAAGSLTFEGDDEIVLWRTCWGGAAYTGSTSGSLVNDGDGNFGPAFPGPLPSTSLVSILITQPASNLSTNSATDYSLSSGPAVFINNARQQFTLVDRCPDDPLKTAAGVCGCGQPDADRDADGSLDCQDACPDDPAKTVAGVCGCGFTDTDRDSDGRADCVDPCPDNSADAAAGACDDAPGDSQNLTASGAAAGGCGAGTSQAGLVTALIVSCVRAGRRRSSN